MRTISSLSNISWNTQDHLKAVLCKLQQAEIIDFWCFIRHLPERDETKEHMHLFLQPTKILDTSKFNRHFDEYVDGEDLPRRPTSDWRRSKFADWFLYASHDPGYLAKKGIARNYHYEKSDFITSDDLAFSARLDEVPNVFGAAQAIINAARTNVPWDKLCASGIVPLANYRQANSLYYDVRQSLDPEFAVQEHERYSFD